MHFFVTCFQLLFTAIGVIGVLSDYPNKRHILTVSFVGSIISYGLIGVTTDKTLLFLSRIIVGGTKQTLTIVNVVITK